MAFTHKVASPIQVIGGVNNATLTGNVTMTPSASPIQYLDGDGTRTLTLPPEEDSNGLWIWVYNFGGEALTFDNDADTPATIGTVATLKAGLFVCDGTTWYKAFTQA